MKKPLLICIFMLIPGFASALEFQPIGARNLAMGGTGVASTMDTLAQYYNPAILGFFGDEQKDSFKDKNWGFNVQAGAGVQTNNNLAEELGNLEDINYDQIKADALGNTVSATTFGESLKLVSTLNKINADKGSVTVKGDTLAAFRYKRFAIGAYGLVEANGRPTVIDTTNIQIGTTDATAKAGLVGATTDGNPVSGQNLSFFTPAQYAALETQLSTINGFSIDEARDIINTASIQLTGSNIGNTDATLSLSQLGNTFSDANASNSIANNDSTITVNGVGLFEVPVSYGHPVADWLAVGASVKFIRARIYETSYTVLDNNNGASDLVKHIDDNYTESNNFGVDAGLLLIPASWLKIGVVGKYLNSPAFDTAVPGEKFRIDPQARAGIAFIPVETVTIAADIDLTENETTLKNYKSRNAGAGIEWDIYKFFALRAGAYKNLAEDDIGWVYTGGFGVNMYLLRFDVAGAFSSNSQKFDGNDIPAETRIQANLSVEF